MDMLKYFKDVNRRTCLKCFFNDVKQAYLSYKITFTHLLLKSVWMLEWHIIRYVAFMLRGGPQFQTSETSGLKHWKYLSYKKLKLLYDFLTGSECLTPEPSFLVRSAIEKINVILI